jgi:hypothetical protein
MMWEMKLFSSKLLVNGQKALDLEEDVREESSRGMLDCAGASERLYLFALI